MLKSVVSVLLKEKPITIGCKKCEDGYVNTPKTEGIGWTCTPCECLVEAESLRYSMGLLRDSGITERLINRYNLTKWKEDEEVAFDTLKEIVEQEEAGENWLFLYGDAGTGKTYASIILALIAIAKEQSVYFVPVAELLDRLGLFDRTSQDKITLYEFLYKSGIFPKQLTDSISLNELLEILNSFKRDGSIIITIHFVTPMQ